MPRRDVHDPQRITITGPESAQAVAGALREIGRAFGRAAGTVRPEPVGAPFRGSMEGAEDESAAGFALAEVVAANLEKCPPEVRAAWRAFRAAVMP